MKLDLIMISKIIFDLQSLKTNNFYSESCNYSISVSDNQRLAKNES
jgi:hypothetical protein